MIVTRGLGRRGEARALLVVAGLGVALFDVGEGPRYALVRLQFRAAVVAEQLRLAAAAASTRELKMEGQQQRDAQVVVLTRRVAVEVEQRDEQPLVFVRKT